MGTNSKITREQILGKIKEIAERVGVDTSQEMTEKSNLQNDLNLDSLDIAEFTIIIETEYRINIPDSNIENFKTIGDVVSYLEEIL